MDDDLDVWSITNGDLGRDLIEEFYNYYADDIHYPYRFDSRHEEDFEYESFTIWAVGELLDRVYRYPSESTLETIIAFNNDMGQMVSIASSEKIRERFCIASECAGYLFDYIIESVNT